MVVLVPGEGAPRGDARRGCPVEACCATPQHEAAFAALLAGDPAGAGGGGEAAPCCGGPELPALKVYQREWALVGPETPCVLGSSEATTCIIVVLRHPATGRCAVAHLDDSSVGDRAAIEALVRKVCRGAAPGPGGRDEVDLYAVGAYNDRAGVGRKNLVALALLLLEMRTTVFRLQLACLGDKNTTADGAPRLTYLAFDTRAGAPRFANLPEGPRYIERSARLWMQLMQGRGGGLVEVFDEEGGNLVFHERRFSLPADAIDSMRGLCSMPDKVLLKYTSTSPEHEDPAYCGRIRETFRFILDGAAAEDPGPGGAPGAEAEPGAGEAPPPRAAAAAGATITFPQGAYQLRPLRDGQGAREGVAADGPRRTVAVGGRG